MTNRLVPQDLIANARSHIDDDFLEEWEKRLQPGGEKRLQPESPDQVFRQTLLTVIAHHLFVPRVGGLASVSRKGVHDAKKYWSDIHTCLSCLLELLPHERFEEHPQAWRLRI